MFISKAQLFLKAQHLTSNDSGVCCTVGTVWRAVSLWGDSGWILLTTSVMVTGKVPIRDTEVLPLREAPLQPSSLYPDFILHL